MRKLLDLIQLEQFLKQHYILTVLSITLSFACLLLIVYEVLGG